jgi:hypothetical protein
MGHERIGFLPRTTKWRTVVDDLARYARGNASVDIIGRKVLDNVRDRFADIADDEGVNAAFSFLVLMAYAAKVQKPVNQLTENGIKLDVQASELQVVKELAKWVERNVESREYSEIAKASAIDAISSWSDRLRTGQESLFGKAESNEDIWRKASDGSGFCELSRLFFSKFTERYLSYFVEREAGSQFLTWEDSGKLRRELSDHVQSVSKYAFETAKITESFAAGWYNKNTKEGLPTRKQIRGFLWLSFEKLREELKRERALQ